MLFIFFLLHIFSKYQFNDFCSEPPSIHATQKCIGIYQSQWSTGVFYQIATQAFRLSGFQALNMTCFSCLVYYYFSVMLSCGRMIFSIIWCQCRSLSLQQQWCSTFSLLFVRLHCDHSIINSSSTQPDNIPHLFEIDY